MPYKSESQRRYFYSQLPELAKKWEADTPNKKLPERISKSKSDSTLHQYIKKHRKV